MAEATVEGRRLSGESETEIRRASPTEYRTFSRNLAPAMTALGGSLAILGGLGTWVRASEFTTGTVGGKASREIGVLMGYTQKAGWTLAALGLVAVVGSLFWFRRNLILKLVTIFASLGAIGIVAARLPSFFSQAQAVLLETRGAAEAGKRLDLSAYHAGLGWGSWFLLLASVLFAVGVIIGVLRELDLRRGMPE